MDEESNARSLSVNVTQNRAHYSQIYKHSTSSIKKNSPWKKKGDKNNCGCSTGKKCSTRILQFSGKGHGLKPINISSFNKMERHIQTFHSWWVQRHSSKEDVSYRINILRACFSFISFFYTIFHVIIFTHDLVFYALERNRVYVHFKWQKHVSWIKLLHEKVFKMEINVKGSNQHR